MIHRALVYMRECKASALFLIPQWKHSYFYPVFMNLHASNAKKRIVYSGKKIFRAGTNSSSFFGPDYCMMGMLKSTILLLYEN